MIANRVNECRERLLLSCRVINASQFVILIRVLHNLLRIDLNDMRMISGRADDGYATGRH